MSDMVGGAYGVAALAATGAAVAAGAYALRRRARRKADAEASAAFRRRKSVEKPWQESQKKGTNSYYYGHHTRPSDGLDAATYTMTVSYTHLRAHET